MNLEYYRIFYNVALNGNTTLTAQKLNMSQPSVSRYITLLEKESNKKLFIRSKQGMKLTPEGHILFNYISKGMEYIQKAEEELDIWQDPWEEKLNIAASPLTTRTIIPPAIEKYKEKFPCVSIKLTTGSSAQAIALLKSGLADMAIIPGPIENDQTLKIEKLSDHESVLIAGKKYENLQGTTLKLSDLLAHPFISLCQGTAGRSYIDHLFADAGLSIIPEIEIPTSDLIAQLVRNNLGFGIVTRLFAEREIQDGTVLEMKLQERLPKRSFLLCTNRYHSLSPRAMEFTKILAGTGKELERYRDFIQ